MRQRGHKKTVVAVGRHILEISFHILGSGATYRDLGPDYFTRLHAERTKRRCLRQLANLGYEVTLANKEAA